MMVVPITFRAACAFVTLLHRHNKPPRGHKFSIGLQDNGVLVGVAMAGRPHQGCVSAEEKEPTLRNFAS